MRGLVTCGHGMASAYRRAVGADSTAAAPREAWTQGRPPSGRSAAVVRRHPVGPLDGGRRGANGPRDTAAPPPAGAGSGKGKRAACSWRSGALSSTSSTPDRNSAGMSASGMAASLRRKRGRQSRQDPAREGHEVEGTGRWRGYSVGSIPGRGGPSGGHPPRKDAGESADPREPERLIADRAPTATPSAAASSGGGFSPSFRPAPTPPRRPIRTAAACAAIAGAGSWNARLGGSATSGA